jgi:hypothetical protein
MKINIEDKNEQQRAVLVLILGLTEALLHKAITIDEAETALFLPANLSFLEGYGINKDILELVELGMELENVETLIPEELEISIIEIKDKALKLLTEIGQAESFDWWVQRPDENAN